MTSFKAILLEKSEDGKTVAAIKELSNSMLAFEDEGWVTVDVSYSTVNFKDGLAVTGKSPVVRKFPLIPGIDLVGKIASSKNKSWKIGDQVVLNGWGVGEAHSGGLSQRACVHGDWLIPKPENLSPWETMAIGTAGYTASLCVLALKQAGVKPEDGEILVTGASGGVGSIAIMLLAANRYQVVASTGKTSEEAHLKSLGASEVLDRKTLSEQSTRPLQKERWAGVVDSVGSWTLANACASAKYGGVVTACGLAQGMDLPATVAPFILRSVSLLGIDSVMAPIQKRLAAWNQLAKFMDKEKLNANSQTIQLSEVIGFSSDILSGKIRGRIVVDVNS